MLLQGLHKEDFILVIQPVTIYPKGSSSIKFNTYHILHFELTGADDVSTSGVDDLSYVDDISCVEDISCVDDVSTSVLLLEIFSIDIAQEGALSGTDDFGGDDKTLGFLNLFCVTLFPLLSNILMILLSSKNVL